MVVISPVNQQSSLVCREVTHTIALLALVSQASMKRSGLTIAGGSRPHVALEAARLAPRAQALLRLQPELERRGKEGPTISERHDGGGHRHSGRLHKGDDNLIPNGHQRRGVVPDHL